MKVRKNSNMILAGMVLAALISGGVPSVYAADQSEAQDDVLLKVDNSGAGRGIMASGITPGRVYDSATGARNDQAGAATNSMAIGGGQPGDGADAAAWTRGQNSVAIGADASVNPVSKYGPNKDNKEEAFRTADGVAVGVESEVNGIGSVAVGHQSLAYANQSVALGRLTKAKGAYSVALGYGSQTKEEGVVSVGSGKEKDKDTFATRRIINVKDGINDSDAATVGQVKTAAEEKAADALDELGINSETVNFDSETKNVSLGTSSNYAGEGSVAVGFGSSVRKDNAVAVGTNTKASGEESVAIGYQAETDKEYSVSLGSGASTNGEKSIAVGTNSHTYGEQEIAVGFGAILDAEATNSMALGNNTTIHGATNSVAIGSDSQVMPYDIKNDAHGVVSFGNSDSDGFKRRLINVKDGINDSDAATVGQIKTITGVDTTKGAAVQYDNTSKGRVTFAGQGGTSLENVSDISMNVEDLFNGKTSAASFQAAGLVPGVSESKYSTVIGRTSFGDPNVGSHSNQSVAIGDAAHIVDNSEKSIALGYNSSVGSYDGGAQRGIAIGTSSNVSGKESIAVGTEAQNNTQNAVAIGDHAVIQKGAVNSIAIGGLYQYSEEGGLGGGGNYQVEEGAKDSVVIGAAGLSQSAGATVLGTGARVTSGAENSVALGAGSEVGEDDLYRSDTHGVVSVGNSMGSGNENFTRRIINVADGKADTDAATYGQLKKLSTSLSGSGIVGGETTDVNGKAVDSAVAVGTGSSARSFGAVAMGASATAWGNGTDPSTAIGFDATAYNKSAVALGAYSMTDADYTVSVGNENLKRRITNVAAGTADNDAVTVGQIKDWKGVDVTKGQAVQYDKDGSLNVNKENSSLKVNSEESSISHGKNSVTADKDGVTISSGNNGIQVSGDKTIITGTTDIKGDLNVSGSLSIGGKTLVTQDKIDNMSKDLGSMKFDNDEAKDMTEAVNKNYAATQQNTKDIASAKKHIGVDDKGNFAAISNGASTLTEGINQNTSAIEQNQRDIQSLGGSVNKLGHEVDSVGAISAALAGLHPIDDDGLSKFQLSAAMGTYDGTQALALGGFYNVSPDVRLSMGLSTNLNGGDRKMAGNVGATFLIGSGVSKSIKSTAAVDQKVEELQAANEAQQKEIDELKAQLQALLNK